MEANIPDKLESGIGHTYANWNYWVSFFYCMSEVLAGLWGCNYGLRGTGPWGKSRFQNLSSAPDS